MFRAQSNDALRTAAAPTLERIRRDGRRARGRLSEVFAIVERDLFDPDLTAGRVWAEARVHDHSNFAHFRALTGTSLKQYIIRRRIEVARRLVHDTDHEIGMISMAVGFSSHGTFLRAYKRQERHRPIDVRRGLVTEERPELPPDGPPGWREFKPAEARSFAKEFFGAHPYLLDELQTLGLEEGPKPEIVDGDFYVRARAEQVWAEIRNLPFEKQKRRVRRYCFRSTGLFDLLLEKSRHEGRRDRRRGIQLAELALVSLEPGAAAFGERIHDLRALGWAWLGNAYRIALDFSAADAAFEEADHELATPRQRRDDLVLARICNLEGTLRMFQRKYDQALTLVGRAQHVFRAVGDPAREARALIMRGSILGYVGNISETIGCLEAAKELVADLNEPYLAYSVAGSLADAHLRAGDYPAALDHLERARRLYTQIEHPPAICELQAVEGFIRHRLGELESAEHLCLQARLGFTAADDRYSVALVDLDLALLYSRQRDWEKVLDLGAEASMLLESLQLHEETLAAVALLAGAIEAGQVAPSVLEKVRHRLELDPLARMPQPARAGGSAGPPELGWLVVGR